MSADITKKLKALKSVAPRTEWKKSNREFLMSEIKSTMPAANEVREKWAMELSKIIFPWRVMKLAARPVLALVSVFALVLGSGLSVSASQLALPGDALYGLKIASEKVQVALTFDKKESAKIHVELAGKRINEIKKIKENTDSDEKKVRRINVAMDKFKEEISTVQNKLENLNKESSAEATVEVAKMVDNKTTEYQKDLVQATNKLPELNGATLNISQSLDLADKMSDAALTMIVEKHAQGEMVLSGEMEEDVLIKRVGEKIEITEKKVTAVQGQVGGLTLPVDPAATLVAQQTADQAKVVLTEAREALNKKDLGIALTKAIESKELVKQAEKIAADAVAAVPAPTEVANCGDACGENGNAAEQNSDLTNTAENVKNTETKANTNTNTVKTYIPIKVVAPPPPVEPVIDESELKVGIDLTQTPTDN